MNEIEQLESTIKALEEQRSTVGDSVVDSAIESIKIRLATLRSIHSTPEKQRKLVSILFMDVVDSSKIGQHLDPEDVMEIMDTGLQRLAAPVFNLGGRVTRFMGDGFLAIFGTPTAREDDTRNAVVAGLEILKVAEIYSREIASDRGIAEFKVRVGINTGGVALGGVTEGIDTIMGRTVNLAARMESAAPPNSLLINQGTYRHVRGYFDTVRQPPLNVKGEDSPVITYLVLGIKPHATSIDTRGIEGITTPFVGRQKELAQLERAYHVSSNENKTQILTIHAGPGVGKTRLAYEFKQLLESQEDDVQIYEGFGVQAQVNNPFSLFRDLFTRYLDIRESDGLQIVRKKMEQGVSEIVDEDGLQSSHYIAAMLGFDFWHSPFLEPVKNEPKQLRQTGQHYLQKFIRKLVGNTPTTIILDDLQWGDDASLNFIDKFVHEFDSLPLLVLNITRPELYERHPEWGKSEIDGDNRFLRIELSTLSEEESCDLVEQILEHAEKPDARLCMLILQNARGNPYYIEEFFNVLIEDGILQRDGIDSPWEIDMSRVDSLRIPTTLTALLQARLDRLPFDEKQTMQQAAVVGITFWDEIISILKDDKSLTAGILDSLVDRDLIRPLAVSTFENMREYHFKHALMHEVTYESVIKQERQDTHGKVADWLAGQADRISRQGEFAAEIASHYQFAKQGDLASEWFLTAADRAKSMAAPAEARNFYEAALELNPEDNLERRWQILLGHDEVVGTLGDSEVRYADDLELVEMARQFNDRKRLARALKRKGYFEYVIGDFKSAIEDLKEALDRAHKAGDIKLETLVYGLLVVSQTRSGKLDDALLSAKKALSLSQELNDDETRARTLTNVAILYTECGDIATAARLLEEQVEINRQTGNKAGEAIGLGNLGYDYIQLGLYEQGQESLKRSIQLTENIGMQLESAYQNLNLALAYCWSEDPDYGKDILVSTIPILEKIGDQFGLGAGFNYMGLCLEGTGDLEGAIAAFLESDRLFSETGASSYAIDPTAGLARCYQRQWKIKKARHKINQVWEYLNKNSGIGMEFPLLAYLTCAEFFLTIEDTDSAQKALQTGYKELVTHSDKISDPNWRKSYLENIITHRKLIELWERTKQAGEMEKRRIDL